MGSRATVLVCRDGSCRPEVRRAGRRDRGGVDADRAGVLRPAADRGVPVGRPRRGHRSRALGRAGHGLAAARRRAAALVAQGRAAAARAVRGDGRGGARDAARRRRVAGGRRAPAGSTWPTCWTGPADGRATPTRFVDAYRRYVWPTDGLDGVQLAPFQVLAARGVDVPRPRPRLAPVRHRPAGRRRPGAAAPDAAAGGRRRRPAGGRSTGGRSSPRPAARGWWSSRSPTWCAAGAGWCSRG